MRHDRHRRRRRRHRQARADIDHDRDARAWAAAELSHILAKAVLSTLVNVDDARMSRLFGSAAARGVA